jgi:hypothetical protein
MLRIELGDLQTDGFDLGLTGFDPGEIASFLIDHTGGLTDPDAVPELPEQPVSRTADVWCLGRHRLACGDSTDPEIVAAVLNGVRPHLMTTDPPYGVAYDPAWRNRAGLGATTRRHRRERPPRGLARGLGAIPWRSGLRLARRTARPDGRACHAIELSPAYVDVAVQRWQAFTGEQAVLEGKHASVAAVLSARAKETVDV